MHVRDLMLLLAALAFASEHPCCNALCCRLLDPQLSTSYPSAILARERAIVVNLEFVKAIIAMGGCGMPCLLWARTRVARGRLSCAAPAAVPPHAVQPHAVVATTIAPCARCPADNIYITNLEDQNTVAFVEELQVRRCGRAEGRPLAAGSWCLAVPAQSYAKTPAGGIALSSSPARLLTSDRLHPPSLPHPQRRLRQAASAAAAAAAGPSAMYLSQSQASLGMGGGGSSANLAGQGPGGVPLSSIQGAHEELPFELRALEIALDTVRGRGGVGWGVTQQTRCTAGGQVAARARMWYGSGRERKAAQHWCAWRRRCGAADACLRVTLSRCLLSPLPNPCRLFLPGQFAGVPIPGAADRRPGGGGAPCPGCPDWQGGLGYRV